MLQAFKKIFVQKGIVDLSIRVRPGASRTEVKEIMIDGSVKISIAAAAEENAANAELIRFLAEEFSVDRSAIAILSGMTARRKLIRIQKS
ncbi:DUF167 domain-containing protein [Candidatus Peregrinibacteria bacterium]|nr:DUF167 domain-containing protein [Candidatus Peregrinibacteria bacterium]